MGYGIRYEFGIFKQAFQDGQQIELPDDWTFYGNPWEFPAPDDLQVVGFYGHTEAVEDDQGGLRARWMPGEMVRGEPSHMLVPGYGTQTVNILRLWRARAGHESFDLGLFNAGRYAEAVEAQMRSENLTKVLYPSDSTEAGRELRLKQQYFLVSCSLRDIIRRFRFRNSDWEAFPGKVAIQLNDTHPVLAIPELMRLLVDENGIGWEQAWSITRRTFAYTCHTLLPEALETWPVPMFGRLLPRHLEIIHALNRSFLADVRARYPGDEGRVARMSLIQEGPEQRVRMANLAVVGSFAVNGVAGLQSRLLAATTLRDFADLWPEKFRNVTNGVSPRRFLRLANPRLSGLITARLGDDRWLTDLERLRELEAFAGDAEFRAQWRELKRQNKLDLAAHALAATGVTIDPASLFDVMVKRLHEYKRQFLKLLHVVTLYNRIKADPAAAVTPCTVIFGAKAAPGYQQAKRIIKLINSVAAVVNADPDVAGRIKVVFIPDYNVSVSEVVMAMSIYEVHLGSWRPGLSYRQLATELVGYVTDLGFTHVEFLPVAEHPFGGSWGYQVTSYYAPTARFGNPDDFRHLVDALHQAGIGVLLDWVPAHFPRDDWALARFDGTPLYEHPDPRRGAQPDWGTLVFNFGRNEVRNFLVANAVYWLEEFHADGLRVDAVASMLYLDYSRKFGEWTPNQYGGRENLDAVSFLQEVNATCYKRDPGITTIAEESTAWPGVSRPVYLGGLGFGFKWNMGWMHDTLGYLSLRPPEVGP